MPYRLAQLSQQHLDYFSSLRGKAGHLADGVFIGEGPKIVRQLFQSHCEILFAYLTPEFFESFEALLDTSHGTPEVHLAPKEEMEKIVGYPLHQGVMLAVKVPAQPALEEILAKNGRLTIVALDGVADAENMGTLVRTSAAFGADAVIIDHTSCDPFLRRSVRVSMGTVVNLPIVRVGQLTDAMKLCSVHGVDSFAAAFTTDAVELRKTRFTERSMLIFGAEGTGISKGVLKAAEHTLYVPMASNIDSLNVGVACGTVLYERSRQMA